VVVKLFAPRGRFRGRRMPPPTRFHPLNGRNHSDMGNHAASTTTAASLAIGGGGDSSSVDSGKASKKADPGSDPPSNGAVGFLCRKRLQRQHTHKRHATPASVYTQPHRTLTSCAPHTHPFLHTAMAFVPYGFVLIQVQVQVLPPNAEGSGHSGDTDPGPRAPSVFGLSF
jgi:hypothetical protein